MILIQKKKKCLNVFSSRHNFEKLISNNREKNSTGCFQTGRYVVLWDATLPVAVIPKIMILLGKMTSLLSQHDLYTSLFYLFASPSGAVEIWFCFINWAGSQVLMVVLYLLDWIPIHIDWSSCLRICISWNK